MSAAARVVEPAPQAAVARIQLKPRLGPVDDPLEHEADRVADAMVRGEAASIASSPRPTSLQAKCAECEEEEKGSIQRKCAACGTHGDGGRHAVDQAARVISSGGSPLTTDARAYFEPRFGRDLSGVRVHTDANAGSAATAIGARAYTLGSRIAFAPGEYAPASPAGQRLLAHELAHVEQQRQGASDTVRRTVSPNSRCPANVHGAPADPIAELTADDERAQLMALGTSNVLALEALTFADPTFGRSYVSDAYERRFGLPPAARRGRFRNRFAGTTHATQNEAMAAEMMALSDRFRTLHQFLAGPIRYRCPGTSTITLPGCAPAACGGAIAQSCPGGRHMSICPTFWTFPLMQTVDQRGGNMIHESVHMKLGFRPHALGNVDQRGRNPECHAAIVGDIYNFQSDDTADCTPLIP